jgi:hypothetical protein
MNALVPRPVSFFQKRNNFRGTRLAKASQINSLCSNQPSSNGKDFLVGALVARRTSFFKKTDDHQGTSFSNASRNNNSHASHSFSNERKLSVHALVLLWAELFIRALLFLTISLFASGCVSLSMIGHYKGPTARPLEVSHYYDVGTSYSSWHEQTRQKNSDYVIRRLVIESAVGPLTVDYFQRSESSDHLVFVFPVLGGKNFIENYFADYFASAGIDTAIVHRNNDFKKPENFDKLEEILRNGLIRDRIAMDFFEKEFKKSKFGSFGISRGAINVAMTAGVDERLKYNILALGGTDLVGLFETSSERRITKYIDAVLKSKQFTKEELIKQLRAKVKTDPKHLSKYLDAENTLMFLGLFDSTVPFSSGMKLREEIGNPETVVLLGNHFTSLMFTQIVKVFPPSKSLCVFPFDYVESESLAFYQRSFGISGYPIQLIPLKVLQAPLNLIANLGREVRQAVFGSPLPDGAPSEVAVAQAQPTTPFDTVVPQ